jgi:hypothetical protein
VSSVCSRTGIRFCGFAVCFVRCALSRYPFSLFNRIFQSTWFHRGGVTRYFVLWIWGPLAYLRCSPAMDSLVRLVYIVRMQYLQYCKFQSLCICLHALEPDTSTFRDKPHKIGCGEIVYQQLGNYPQQTTSTTLTFKIANVNMGSWFSSPTPPPLSEKSPTSQPRHFPYHNLSVPAEASTTPEDSEDWYTNFYEKASVAPHKDGQSLIICRPSWRADGFPLFEGDDGVGDAWPVHHIEKVYKKLGGDHARVVRYVLYSNEMGGWREVGSLRVS